MRAHDSQAYTNMNVTREHINRILKLGEILLSFQSDFNLVNAAVVCAILESISGLEPSSIITPRPLSSLPPAVADHPGSQPTQLPESKTEQNKTKAIVRILKKMRADSAERRSVDRLTVLALWALVSAGTDTGRVVTSLALAAIVTHGVVTPP